MRELFQMKKLFFALFLTGLPWLLPGIETVTYRSSSGVSLHSSDTLRKLERFLREFFPRSPYRKRALTIDITGAGLPLPPVRGYCIELKVADLDSFLLEPLSRAGGAMLHAWGKAPENFRLPLFFCAAFRHRERSLKKEGRFIGNNRRFNSVEVFLKAGARPPLKELLSLKDPDSDPVSARWYDDHARLLLELLRRKGFKGDPADLQKAAEKLLKSDILQEDISEHIWNSFRLLPVPLIRRELDQLQQVRLPRLDHNGEVNGLYEEISVSLMASKLRRHPLRQELFQNYALRVSDSAARLPRFLRGALRELQESANALGRADSAPELEERFSRALRSVEETFQLCRSRARALDEAALRFENPVLLLRNSLTENSRPPKISAPEADRFFQRWNEYYNSN